MGGYVALNISMAMLKSFTNFIREADDYHGGHTAPGPGAGAPLHNLTHGTYPDDVYTLPLSTVVRYYGTGGEDNLAFSIVLSAKGKPRQTVIIYRAVPKILSVGDRIAEIGKEKAYIQKYGRVPNYVKTALGTSQYYDQIHTELERLKHQPATNTPSPTINAGDWVAIDRRYANDHGESALHGRYRVLTKRVPAYTLFTNGDSIQEWGYHPNASVVPSSK